MTLRPFACFAAALTIVAAVAGHSPVSAQTSMGWNQHINPYGRGYVGNVPNTLPQTQFYRAPIVGGVGQPVTTMYTPAAGLPTTVGYAPGAGIGPASGYSPTVSYRLGTPNAAAYTTAYSPIVTPTTPYNANWQYPPQTVFPTTAQPVTANYAPAPYLGSMGTPTISAAGAGPVTFYRPVTVMSPVAGTTQTVLQPCTAPGCQSGHHRHCGFGFCSWLFNHHRRPATPVVPVVPVVPAVPLAPPTVIAPTVTNYPCPTPCASNACPQPAAVSQPYYTPGAATISPAPSGVSVPANTIPTLSSPPTITTPSTPLPTTTLPLGTSGATIAPPTGIPANVAPTLSPGTVPFSGAGPQRLDYAPVVDNYAPSNFAPNVSVPATVVPAPVVPQTVVPAVPYAPAYPAGPITPVPDVNGYNNGNGYSNGNGAADQRPSLLGPSNNRDANPANGNGQPATNGVQHDDGARLQARPQYQVETNQPPRAVIRRDSNITPIPDPEYPRLPATGGGPIGSGVIGSGASDSGNKARVNNAPALISPRDRTAYASPNATKADAQLASFEREMPLIQPIRSAATQPIVTQPTVTQPAAAPQRKVLGDDIWRSAKQ